MTQIRTKCIESIGKLVVQYKSKFLDNSYLKYVGWALYDKVISAQPRALPLLPLSGALGDGD